MDTKLPWPERLTEPDAGPAGSLEEAARNELANLWCDLERAVKEANRGGWSTGCIGLANRIRSLTRLVGPARWGEVPFALVDSGLFQRLHAEWEVPVEIDSAEFAAFRRYWHEEYLPSGSVSS
jgi:hypothetical protein